MQYCANCGQTLGDGVAFCRSCGVPVAWASPKMSKPPAAGGGLPPLPPAPTKLTVATEPTAPTAPTSAPDRPRTPSVWMAGALVVVAAVLAAGIAVLLLRPAADPDPAATATATDPPDVDADGTAPATTAPVATTGAVSTTAGFQAHRGRFFDVEVPGDWVATAVDVDPGYAAPSTQTRWEAPDGSFLLIDTSANFTGTIEGSCDTIFAGVSDKTVLQGPTTTTLGPHDTCSIEWTEDDGESRVDIFLADGDRGFAVLAGSVTDFAGARDVARHAAATLQRTD